MVAQCTRALGQVLLGLGQDPAEFAATFDRWKASGPAGEYNNFLFGKDGAYRAPQVEGVPHVLRHVHLVPLADPSALRTWNLHWSRRSRKSSNRALVYASDRTHGHLLIYILDEPSAHEVARMATAADRALMLKFARIASCFIQDGSIIG